MSCSGSRLCPVLDSNHFLVTEKILLMVEFIHEFVDLHWCEKGHISAILSGELEIDLKGKVVRYPCQPSGGLE